MTSLPAIRSPFVEEDAGACRHKLIQALAQLDEILERAVRQVQSTEPADPLAVFYRGLQIRQEDAERLFMAEPGSSRFQPQESTLSLGEGVPRLERLAETFGLSAFDVNTLLLALAPEVDLRYERLYAYLNDDVTRKRSTVDLALNLFSTTARSRIELRSRFSTEAPLVYHRLVHLIADPSQVQPPLLAHYLKFDDQLLAFLLGEDSLDPRLASFCRFVEAGIGENAPAEPLALVAARTLEAGRPLRLYFQGPAAVGKLRAALTVARAAGARLLAVDLAQAPEAMPIFQDALRVAFRQAWLNQSVLYLDGVDGMRREERAPAWRALMDLITEHSGTLLLSGTLPWVPIPRGPAGVFTVRFEVLDSAQALETWRCHLLREGVQVPAADLDLLADRFRLTEEQVADAVLCAANEARWRQAVEFGSSAPGNPEVTLDGLCAAARAECGHELTKLARKIQPKYRWDDIVLPADQVEQLHEVCEQAHYRRMVFGEWGFERKLSLGRGLNVLFSGPPGTGKTMAAEVLATELQLDLYKIDLAQVVSKYIGETEKNLDRIFTLAENSNAILFFDEADALFGKRTEVKDSHDRYANIEIGYLLQKMEEYDGIAILATNVKHHIDEAFVRRMQVIIEFPFPEEAERQRVWQVIFPAQTPVGADVDFQALARSVRLAGGNIRSIARASAFYAAADGGTIHMQHLIRASRREYQKLGRTWNESECSSAMAEAAV